MGARKSATRSHNVVSVSCPTAETIGIRDSKTFLTNYKNSHKINDACYLVEWKHRNPKKAREI